MVKVERMRSRKSLRKAQPVPTGIVLGAEAWLYVAPQLSTKAAPQLKCGILPAPARPTLAIDLRLPSTRVVSCQRGFFHSETLPSVR